MKNSKKAFKVMFDTNTYRHIIDGTADSYNTAEVYDAIRQLIVDGKIEAFLSETLFTIEAINKNDRLAFISNQRPKITQTEKCGDSVVSLHITMGPDQEHQVSFEGTGPLKDYYNKAKELGFQIVRLPRIGGITNKEITNNELYPIPRESFNDFMNLASSVSEGIQGRGAGEAHIQKILADYSGDNIYSRFYNMCNSINSLPLQEKRSKIKKVAKAIAELSDADSVSCSIGLHCDAFCTNDMAKSAGEQSILSIENVQWLKDTYAFNKVTPTELLNCIYEKSSNLD